MTTILPKDLLSETYCCLSFRRLTAFHACIWGFLHQIKHDYCGLGKHLCWTYQESPIPSQYIRHRPHRSSQHHARQDSEDTDPDASQDAVVDRGDGCGCRQGRWSFPGKEGDGSYRCRMKSKEPFVLDISVYINHVMEFGTLYIRGYMVHII